MQPLGIFVGAAVAGVDPRLMGIGPVPATRKLLARTGIGLDKIDLVEMNEAFASQSVAVMRELGLRHRDPQCQRRRDRDRPSTWHERRSPRRFFAPRTSSPGRALRPHRSLRRGGAGASRLVER